MIKPNLPGFAQLEIKFAEAEQRVARGEFVATAAEYLLREDARAFCFILCQRTEGRKHVPCDLLIKGLQFILETPVPPATLGARGRVCWQPAHVASVHEAPHEALG